MLRSQSYLIKMSTQSIATKLLMRTIDWTPGSNNSTSSDNLSIVNTLLTQHVSAPAVNLAPPTLIFTSLIKVIVVWLALNQRPASVQDDRGKYKASLTVMESSGGFY